VPDRCDLIVLRAGVGGAEVAGNGLDAPAIEKRLVGGECPYWGCIPSKAMTRAASVLGETARAGRLTGKSAVRHDWTVLASRVAEMSERWDDARAADRLERCGTTLLPGYGRIVGPADVEQRHRGSGKDPVASGYPGHQVAPAVPAAGVPAVRASPRGARMPRGLQAARLCLRGDRPDRQDRPAAGKDRTRDVRLLDLARDRGSGLGSPAKTPDKGRRPLTGR
jgi:hypothetical protein